jgi:hypothetical protein
VQLIGLKAKLYAKKRHAEKVLMKRTIAQHSERNNKHKADEEAPKGAVPHYLLDREQVRARLAAGCCAAWAFVCWWRSASPGISIYEILLLRGYPLWEQCGSYD